MKIVDAILKYLTYLVLFFTYLPLIIVIIFSFNSSRSPLIFQSFTFMNYINLFSKGELWVSWYNSVWIAVIVMVTSLFVGFLLAYAVSRYDFRGKDGIDMFILVPIIIPEIVEALTLLLTFVILKISLSSFTIIVGHLVWDIGYVYIVLKASLTGLSKEYEEAARTLGANEIQTFSKILIPIILPGIFSAGLISFLMSYDDFIKTYFTRPGGFETLPVYIYTKAARRGFSLSLNALTTIIVVVALVFVYLRLRLSKEV